jgi:hypothetical protein
LWLKDDRGRHNRPCEYGNPRGGKTELSVSWSTSLCPIRNDRPAFSSHSVAGPIRPYRVIRVEGGVIGRKNRCRCPVGLKGTGYFYAVGDRGAIGVGPRKLKTCLAHCQVDGGWFGQVWRRYGVYQSGQLKLHDLRGGTLSSIAVVCRDRHIPLSIGRHSGIRAPHVRLTAHVPDLIELTGNSAEVGSVSS